jgi:U3 small nucleolar RNA-associated protein 12
VGCTGRERTISVMSCPTGSVIASNNRLYSLRGHRDQITSIRFLTTTASPSTSTSTSPGYILTSSKDTFLKLWDLSTQHCIQTVVAHRSELWSFDIDQSGTMIFTGSGEGELKAWKIDQDALNEGISETSSGEVCLSSDRYIGSN